MLDSSQGFPWKKLRYTFENAILWRLVFQFDCWHPKYMGKFFIFSHPNVSYRKGIITHQFWSHQVIFIISKSWLDSLKHSREVEFIWSIDYGRSRGSGIISILRWSFWMVTKDIKYADKLIEKNFYWILTDKNSNLVLIISCFDTTLPTPYPDLIVSHGNLVKTDHQSFYDRLQHK